MSRLFSELVNTGLYKNLSTVLDWLFDDNRFQYWDKANVCLLTKRIKRMPFIGEETYVYNSIKKLEFPKKAQDNLLIMISKSESESKDLIRHIRNGIAHGNARIICRNGNNYIEIFDYNKGKLQTAYIFIPIDYIMEIYSLFNQIKKQKVKRS